MNGHGLLFPESCWSHFLRLTRPTLSPWGAATSISRTLLCFPCNSWYHGIFRHSIFTWLKDNASLAAVSIRELCLHKHFYTLLEWGLENWWSSILHSSPLHTILRNFSAFHPAMPLLGEKSTKNCMTLHRGPKISEQSQASLLLTLQQHFGFF